MRLGGLRSVLRRFCDEAAEDDFGSTSNRFHLGLALTRFAPSSIVLGTFLTSLSFVALASDGGLFASTAAAAVVVVVT